MCKKTLRNLAAVILACLSASVANAAYTPILLKASSYNADVIVESNATPSLTVVTTATVDNGSNNTANTWFEIGYDTANPGNGLPLAGSVIVAQDNANYSFKMPPTYAGPNGILIDTVVTNGTFTLTTPTAYNFLSFIGSGGNGGDVIGVRVNHADSTFEVGSFGCPDWFGGTGIAYTAGGRLQSPVTFTTEVDGGNPRIYFRDVTLTNTTSPVTSIVLTYSSGGAGSHNDVLGVSGATTPGGPVNPITVTGYTYDFVCEASAPKRGRVVTPIIVDSTNVWATTQTMDNDGNTGFCWYEKGYDVNMINNGPVIYGNPTVNAIAQASGLPVHGTTFTNGNYSFTMAPDYTTNDVVWVSPVVTNATITPVTPTLAAALSFLCAAGNGPVNPSVIVHHQDGTSETNTITIVDWFSGNTPMYIPNGRVQAESGQWSQQLFAGNGANRLFNVDVLLANTTSPITSIDVVYNDAGGRAGIFAVSGAAVAPPVFTQQPPSTNVYSGTPVGLSVVASGTALTYQWQKGTNGVYANLANGGNIAGVTTANLVVSPLGVSDEADYRVIVSNAGGSLPSSVATIRVFSSATDVTAPGDQIANLPNMNPFGDGPVANAINDDVGTKWGAGVNGPSGCVISPAVGATLVNALRIYTGNDTTDRDPADYKLEGSIDGGATYSLIASNSLSLPDGRNTTGGAPDPLTQFVQEVRFSNSQGYSTYRLTFSHYKGAAGSMQLEELELLGVPTNILSAIVPPTVKAYVAGPLNISAIVNGSPIPTTRWQKQISGVFTDLTDGGTISGSHTAVLTINPAAYGDSGGLFRAIASNTSGSSTSGVAVVTILSTNVDVTIPGDSVVDFGNTSTTPSTTDGAINDNYASFTTRGSGLNNNAGFPPFAGPVGFVVTPSAGSTLITALRLYPGSEGSQQDPADVKLEGSNNGGTSYTTLISTMALAIPDDRNSVAAPAIDPITTAVQEIRFPNTQPYTSYRLTFNHTKDDSSSSALTFGEMELLGFAVPTVSIAPGASGGLDITSSTPGTLLSKTNLSTGVWINEGPISGTINIIPDPKQPTKFYRVSNP